MATVTRAPAAIPPSSSRDTSTSALDQRRLRGERPRWALVSAPQVSLRRWRRGRLGVRAGAGVVARGRSAATAPSMRTPPAMARMVSVSPKAAAAKSMATSGSSSIRMVRCVDGRRTRLARGAATLLSSHAGHPRPATSDTTRKVMPAGPTASKRVRSPPVGTFSSAPDVTDAGSTTASLIAEAAGAAGPNVAWREKQWSMPCAWRSAGPRAPKAQRSLS